MVGKSQNVGFKLIAAIRARPPECPASPEPDVPATALTAADSERG